jgi:hypothetical protein
MPKTRIVGRANLNFKQSRPYFDFLLSAGHIKKNCPSNATTGVYELTNKGERLLSLLQDVEAELEELFTPDRVTPQQKRQIHSRSFERGVNTQAKAHS